MNKYISVNNILLEVVAGKKLIWLYCLPFMDFLASSANGNKISKFFAPGHLELK